MASWYLNEVGTRCAKTVTCKLEKNFVRGVHTNTRVQIIEKFFWKRCSSANCSVFFAFRLKRGFFLGTQTVIFARRLCQYFWSLYNTKVYFYKLNEHFQPCGCVSNVKTCPVIGGFKVVLGSIPVCVYQLQVGRTFVHLAKKYFKSISKYCVRSYNTHFIKLVNIPLVWWAISRKWG